MLSLSLPRLKNPKSLFLICLSGCLAIISIAGCGPSQEETLYSKSEAERKFIQICKEEYDWDVTTKYVGNSLWVYLPYEDDILQFKVNKFPQKASEFSVVFSGGEFSKEAFQFQYQITPLLKSEEDRGLSNSLTDQVGEDFHYLLNAIYRVYFNAESAEQPEFYVLVLADIANGVEVRYTVYGLDLKKAYSNAMPGEEYYKRILQDIEGNLAIIRDRTGRHLTYEEIIFGEFLAKQVAQRIRIRFSDGDFQLKGTVEDEILQIFSYCMGTYEFSDYLMVILEDLTSGGKTIKYRSSIEEITEL